MVPLVKTSHLASAVYLRSICGLSAVYLRSICGLSAVYDDRFGRALGCLVSALSSTSRRRVGQAWTSGCPAKIAPAGSPPPSRGLRPPAGTSCPAPAPGGRIRGLWASWLVGRWHFAFNPVF